MCSESLARQKDEIFSCLFLGDDVITAVRTLIASQIRQNIGFGGTPLATKPETKITVEHYQIRGLYSWRHPDLIMLNSYLYFRFSYQKGPSKNAMIFS